MSKKISKKKNLENLMQPAMLSPKRDLWKGWKKRICIAVPATGLVRIEWMMARFGQVVPCNWSNGDIFQYFDQFSPMGWAVADARNICVEYFISNKFEWLFFLDHDVILPPDAFLKINEYMRKADVPIISGLYYCKGSHPEPLVFRGRGNSYYDKWKRGDKVWVDGIPMGCFPAGSLVRTSDGYKAIETINRGEQVITHNGKLNKVYEETIRNYEGKMVKITTNKFNLPVELTEEHPVLAVEGKHMSNGMLRKPNSAFRKYRNYKPEFIKAGDLTDRHIVLYPIDKSVVSKEKFFMSDYLKDLSVVDNKVAYKNKNKVQTKWFSNEVKITDDLMKLIGYYLSEGSSSKSNLKFSFNKKEVEHIEEVQKLLFDVFGVKSSLDLSNIENNGISVVVCSKLLVKLFGEIFGKGALNKKIESFVMTLPAVIQMNLLKSLWNGDGYISNKNRNLLGYVTVSKKLALSVRDLLLRQGIIPSIRKSQYTNRDTYRYDIVVSGEEANKLRCLMGLEEISNINKQGSLAWIDDGYLWLPIRKIEKYDYKGEVYNLSVEKDESYCTMNFAVHNCTLIHRSIIERLYNTSEIYTCRTMNGPVVVRRVFETPRKVWFDPEKLTYAKKVGTEDLFWCDRIKNEKVFENCGVKKYKKFQKKKYPLLIDTSLYCRHINESGQMFP